MEIQVLDNMDVKEWLAEKRSPVTRRTYENRLRKFLTYHNMTVEEFLKLSTRKQRHICLLYQNQNLETMNPNSINTVLTAVSSFLDYLDRPINWKRSRIKSRPDLTSHVFSNGDLSKMFAVGNTKEKALLAMATSLGWEISSILRIKRKTLRDLIERAKANGQKFIYFRNIRRKTGALRLGVLNPLAIEWLDKWLDESENYKQRKRGPNRESKVNVISEVFDVTGLGVNKMLKRLARDAQIKTTGSVHFHKIRAWVMSGLSRAGFNEFQIKFVMGKSVPLSDSTYLTSLEQEVEERYPEAFENNMNLNPTVSPKAVMSLTKELEAKSDEIAELQSQISELRTKFNGFSRIRDSSDLLMREILNDPRFERLLAEKVSEGLEVREDVVKDGKIVDIKIHKLTTRDLPFKRGQTLRRL